jgi:voltage-gated sodium channel
MVQEAYIIAGSGFRAGSARLAQSGMFERLIIGLILINAVTLGLETSDRVMGAIGGFLHVVDTVLLLLFTAELVLRIYAFRGGFFRDPWSIFDFAVVIIAWLPATGALSVLRALRILRVLRLISIIPSLRNVVEAMLAALPRVGSIMLLMALMLYVSAVITTKLFGAMAEEQFGTLGTSILSLLQLMTLDAWVDIVRLPIEAQPWAILFFMPFIIISTFVVLNLFCGVIVESIQLGREKKPETDIPDIAAVLAEVRALRAEVAALRR